MNKQVKTNQVKDSLVNVKNDSSVCRKEKCTDITCKKTCCEISEKPTRLDSIREAILTLNGGQKDSITYEFKLDKEMGTEGNDGTAFYEKGVLKKVILIIYNKSEQCNASYTYLTENKIKVCEKNCFYVKSIDDIKNVKGNPSTKEYCSYVNENGESLGKLGSKKNSIARKTFLILKRNIPYFLKTNSTKNSQLASIKSTKK